ncbi:MAG: periplasmic heavy metal sensor [Chitinophagaceae bacterium]|nr:periplasmic heavy metal sensor [Chitinophagaceae bacterium]
MHSLLNNKYINLLLIVLLVGNMITIGIFWWQQKKPSNDPPERQRKEVLEFLVKELNMTPSQREQLMALREEHRKQVPELRRDIDRSREVFFSSLKDTTLREAQIDSLFKPVAEAEQVFQKSIWLHFRKIRAVCTPAQQVEFDRIVLEALRIMQPAGGPRRGPEGDGPPPPQGERHP